MLRRNSAKLSPCAAKEAGTVINTKANKYLHFMIKRSIPDVAIRHTIGLCEPCENFLLKESLINCHCERSEAISLACQTMG